VEIEDIYRDLPNLETPRLLLRKLTTEDTPGMFNYASNEEVAKYVTWDAHKTLKDTETFVNFVLNQYKAHKVSPWAIEEKETGTFIGTIDFVWWKPVHNMAEIGYVISPDYWGKGITTEAAKAIIQFGFEQMDLVRIQARCLVENIASQRVMEKVGMSYEGTHRKSMFLKGKHYDLKMYAILKEDFALQ
jgi:[ribosomal protein S5]-alanine N-acetyltransferase